jgi:DNA-binding transcriptional ArsR family regulator
MASRDHEWFVGEMGLTFEADGFTRIGGRLFGHLLLAERPLSLDEIAATLRVSKASVSTDARRLFEKGVVVRSGKPGDRRDYWQIAPDFFASLMQYRVERWRRLNMVVGELKRRSPAPSAAVRARLRYMEDVYAYISGRVDDALDSWRSRHTLKPARAGRPGAAARKPSRKPPAKPAHKPLRPGHAA